MSRELLERIKISDKGELNYIEAETISNYTKEIQEALKHKDIVFVADIQGIRLTWKGGRISIGIRGEQALSGASARVRLQVGIKGLDEFLKQYAKHIEL